MDIPGRPVQRTPAQVKADLIARFPGVEQFPWDPAPAPAASSENLAFLVGCVYDLADHADASTPTKG